MPTRKVKFVNSNPPNQGKGKKVNINKNFGNPVSPRPLIEKEDANFIRESVSKSIKMALKPEVQPDKEKVRLRRPSDLKTREAASTPTSSQPQSTAPVPSSSTSTTTTSTTMGKSNRNRNTTSRQTTSSDRGVNPSPFDSRPGRQTSAYTEPPIESGFSSTDTSPIIGGNIFGDGIAKQIEFNIPVEVTQYLNDKETSTCGNLECRPKYLINFSRFSDAFPTTSSTTNLGYKDFMTSLYGRYNVDVVNTLNSYTATNWTTDKFFTAMKNICAALEYHYCIDSILAYTPGTLGDYNTNTTAETYKYNLTSVTALMADRARLKSALKGCWFPSNFAAMIRWFYQGYKTSPLDQSACYRYVCDAGFKDAVPTVSLTTIVNNILPGTDAGNISAILSKVYPSGRLNNLLPSCSDFVYDRVHHEIFVNEPILFTNWSDTNANSVYPIVYRETNSEIPYYTNINPGPNSPNVGIAYVLQYIGVKATGSSNYVSDDFVGIRKPFQAVVATGNTTNKGYFDNSSGLNCYTRYDNSVGNVYLAGLDAHGAVFYYASGSSTKTARMRSMCVNGFQRSYFNSENGPSLTIGRFLNALFQTKV